jgi:HlyD family secretion protein
MMRIGNTKKWIWGSTAAALLAAGYFFIGGGDASELDVPIFNTQKGQLQINVLQGGEIRALRNVELKSEIETPTKILSLIPEGYLVTEEDIKEGKVLVELDDSDIKTRIVDNEILFQTTVATYIEADEQRDIQKSENQNLFMEHKQAALFALMDLEKYLGKQASMGVLKTSGLPETIEAFDAFIAATEAAANKPLLKSAETESTAAGTAKPKAMAKKATTGRINFLPFLEGNTLEDGEAQQKLRQLEDEVLLHKSEESLAKQNFEASGRLASKKFITQSALENDELTLEKSTLTVKTAETALDLFKKYEFTKQCETFLGAYREALNKAERSVRENRSRMAQVESKFNTAKRRYEVELAKKEDLERQLKACVIRATQVGLVAYGDLNASYSSRYTESIEEGASVRLRQTILTIPDMSNMSAHMNIHESQVKKVKIGMRALVRVDAEPGKVLEAKVAELAVLPDSASTRYTPNVKVYPCTIHIDGTYDWLKPGMNAKIDIVVNELADVLYVPVQAIEVEDDTHFCYVSNGSKLERREIETGLFNDEFIEIRNGLTAGDAVALALPQKGTADGQKNAPEKELDLPAKPPAPVKEKSIAKS